MFHALEANGAQGGQAQQQLGESARSVGVLGLAVLFEGGVHLLPENFDVGTTRETLDVYGVGCGGCREGEMDVVGLWRWRVWKKGCGGGDGCGGAMGVEVDEEGEMDVVGLWVWRVWRRGRWW